MRRTIPTVVSFVVIASASWAATPPPTPTPTRDRAVYQPKHLDPVLREIEDAADAAATKAANETTKIRADRKAAAKEEDAKAKTLRFDVTGIVRPTSPDSFTATRRRGSGRGRTDRLFKKEKEKLQKEFLEHKRQLIFDAWLTQERQRAKIKISELPS